MKITVLFVVVVLLSVFSVTGGNPDTDYRILRPGNFHGSEVSSIEAGGWYGFFKTDSGHVLEPVAIQSQPCHDLITDEPGDTTGTAVSVNHPLKPLILIQSPHKLKSGLVSTIFSGYELIKPGALIHLEDYYLTALGQISDQEKRHPGNLLILDYMIKLYKYPYKRDARQTLVEYERSVYESLPVLLWAGDLDRDGKLDLLLDIRNHYNIRHYALFLSSEASSNDLVKLVASFRTGGC